MSSAPRFYATSGRSSQPDKPAGKKKTVTNLSSGRRPLALHLFLSSFRFLLNHAQQRITSPLQLQRRPTLEEPIEPEHRELRDVFLNPFVNVVHAHSVVVESAKEIPVLFFGIDFAFCGGVVEFELLHGVANGVDLLGEEGLEIGAFVALRFTLGDTC